MKINISFREKGQVKEKNGIKASELLVLCNREDIYIEKCDIIDDNGKFISNFDLVSLKSVVSQYI